MTDFLRNLGFSLLGLFIMLVLLYGIFRIAKRHGPSLTRNIAGTAESLIDPGA